jgi:hypothetical protein
MTDALEGAGNGTEDLLSELVGQLVNVARAARDHVERDVMPRADSLRTYSKNACRRDTVDFPIVGLRMIRWRPQDRERGESVRVHANVVECRGKRCEF